MELDTVGVVYVDVLLLRHGKVLVVVKPPGISNRLAELQLTPQLPFPPFHRRNMSFSPSHQQIPSVAAVVEPVGAQLLKLELKPLLCCRNAHIVRDVVLADLVGAFKLVLGLEEAALVLEQDLSLLGLQGGLLVLRFEGGEVSP